MGSRRGHHEGTVRKRSDDRWEAMVSLPDGERKSLYGKTRGEVVAKMRGVHEGLAKGIMPAKDSVLLRDYVERWLEGVKLSVEFTTWRRYGYHVRCLLDYLGSRRLSKLSVDDLRSMHANLLEEGYAAQTIHVLHSILHHALQDAMAEGLVGRNVAELVKPPRAQPVEMQPLTRDEARTLLEGSGDDRFHALWVLAVTTGMRIGELLALEWGDIDFSRGHLTVNRSAYFKQGLGMLIKAPKTKRSRRVIRLNANVLAELKAHRARQNQERLAAGAIWLDRGIVFCNEVGGYTYHSSVLRRFRQTLKLCGLPRIRLHDLRHTAATLMLASGVNIKVVSEMLGHSSVSTTLTIYAHVTEDMQEHAARAMGQIFFD